MHPRRYIYRLPHRTTGSCALQQGATTQVLVTVLCVFRHGDHEVFDHVGSGWEQRIESAFVMTGEAWVDLARPLTMKEQRRKIISKARVTHTH
jgi:hypothetical protein